MVMGEKRYLKYFTLSSMLLVQSAWANFSGNYSLVSDYVWRGQTQTNHGPAVQGGLEYSHDTGVRLGIFFSNVDFEGRIEVENDVYADYTYSLNDDVSFAVGAGWYNYPRKLMNGARNGLEYSLLANYKMISFGIYYVDEYFHVKSSSLYYKLSGNFELPMDLALGLSIGQTKHQHEQRIGHTSYRDYLISLGKTFQGTTLTINHSNTNRLAKDTTTGVETKCSQNISACDRNYFVSIGRTF